MDALPFVPLCEVGDRPNLMVDGAPLASSVLTLSHWPASPTPPALRHDLSAGSVFAWLRSRRSGRRWSPVEPAVVTTDHVDQDGLVSVLVASRPELAQDLEEELMALAAAGDFARGHSPNALRASFAVSGLAESWPRRPGADPALEGNLHREGLARIPDLLRHPGRWRADWEEEEGFLEDSRLEVASGTVVLEDEPAADLLVVACADRPWRPASQLGRRRPAPVHPVVVHNLSDRSRVLFSCPPRYELYFRYETWVRLGAPWRPRVDLSGLASRLSAAEPGGVRWAFNGTRATIARLQPEGAGASDLPPELVRRHVVAALSAAMET